MSGAWLGLAGALVVAGGWALWFRRIQQVAIPADRRAYLFAMGAGAALGIAAFATGPGWLGGLAGGFAVLAGGAFLALRAISRQAAVTPRVAVGSPVLDFTAPDADGEPFQLASLRGRPFLLKFFRGHW